MSDTFISAASWRSRDTALLRLIRPRLTHDSGLWRIEHRIGAGRCLVAATKIPAGTKIFTERPLVVAKGGAAAIARGVLALDRDSDEFAAADQLHSPATRESDGFGPWAAGLAANNVHGAGGNLLDPTADRRAVLGLLASMMMHECCPSCVTHISGSSDGSLVSLHTVRSLEPGMPLSISYVGAYQPTARRRELLLRQHRFLCQCRRCTALPEHTRAFRCPNCEEGPCSPASPLASCRDLECDNCEAVMRLDEEMWQGLLDAERCPVVCEDCMSALHPYHHKPILMYQVNLLKLQPSQRADFLLQQADARERLYASFCGDEAGTAHPLVANDIEAAAVALLAGGDAAGARRHFTDAGARFAAFYGAASSDAARCTKAAQLERIEDYEALGAEQLEVLAHH